MSSKRPSSVHSKGVISTPRQKRFRPSRSVGSPASSTRSVKLSSMVQDNEKDLFIFSPLPSRRSVLTDNTQIEMPKRRSWWKRLDENSKDIMEYIEQREHKRTANIEELIDAEILSQEKSNYTIDLPESSDADSIRSIVLPQKKLFTQKDQAQKGYKNIMDKREVLERLQKSKINCDNTIHVQKKDLFNKGNRERSKPVFPAALLDISLDKTVMNKKDTDISKQGQVRNLFGNQLGTKRKNMFAEFLVSDSDDEIFDIQPKVFGFAKNSEQSQSHGIRETSPTSDITDAELNDWRLLPSSTMVENQFGILENNTPAKKARLSKTTPALDETLKSKSDKGGTSKRSSKNSEKSFEKKSTEDELQDKTLTENNVRSNSSKTSQVNNEFINVVESCAKVPERQQNKYIPTDMPMEHLDLRKSTADENVSRNNKEILQKNGEFVPSKENQEQIGDIRMGQISKRNEHNLQENEENVASEINREDCGDIEMSHNDDDGQQGHENNYENVQEEKKSETDEGNEEGSGDIEMSQNITEINDDDQQEEETNDEDVQEEETIDEDVQEEETNDEDVQEEETNDEDVQEEEESETDERNEEGSGDIEMSQNISENNDENRMEDEECKSADGNQKEINDNEISRNNSKNEENSKSLNKSKRKGINKSRDGENSDVIDKHNQDKDVEENNETQANSIKDLNNSQRKDKNGSREIHNNLTTRNSTIQNKANPDRSVKNHSKLNASHDTTGRNRERQEIEVKSPEEKEVRNYIANDVEAILPAGREKSLRKTQSILKIKELRPSLAPSEEGTGLSDGSNNSSVERSGWDSHRTTRKTLRQTFGKDFTPRKSLRTMVMERAAKRQTYGFDVTTKIPQACSTRLPENMHDITNDENDEIIDQQHESGVQIEASEKVPVADTEQDRNKERTFLNNSTRKDGVEQKKSMGNETRLKLQENDVGSKEQTSVHNNSAEEHNSRKSKTSDDIEREEPRNIQERGEELVEKSTSQEVKEIENAEDNEVEENDEAMRNSQEAEVETSDAEMQDSESNNIEENVEESEENDEEIEENDEEVEENEEEINENDENIAENEEEIEDNDKEIEENDQDIEDSQNFEVEANDEEMQSQDIQEDAESEEERRDSQDIEEGESSQEVEADEESDQEMRYSEDDEAQESEEERRDSQDNEVQSEEEREESQNNETEESEGRRYSSQIIAEEESDEENVDSQNARNVSKQRFFINNSTRDQSSHFTEESDREDSLTRRQKIMEILQKLKQQNLEMSRQAELAVRNALKRPPRDSLDVFKMPQPPKRSKPASKPKPKTVKTHVGIVKLPPEFLEDLNYKPPKRYRPSNASWITKRLYKYLETKLEQKYDYMARVEAEKLVEALYEFTKETRRRNVADTNSVDVLKNKMARLGIVSTHFEFNQFIHDFMPREIRIKVVPDIVNKISMPRHGIFSNIIR